MTLPSLSPDASGPICHLGAYCLRPLCDVPAQVLLWTNALYAKREVRSIGDIPHGGFVVGRYTYSHVLFLKPRLVAFSEMARLMWSETPSGKSAVISTLTFTVA